MLPSYQFFFPRTDRQTDRQTFGIIEAPVPELKNSSRDDIRDSNVPVSRIQFLNSTDVPRNQK